MNIIMGKWPAVVSSVDQDTRIVRVELEGLTDGSMEYPEAEIQYPIGDKSWHTEIRILQGDLVWVEFQGGDPRYPIITGYRAKNAGNEAAAGWRRWHHENIEGRADAKFLIYAGENVTVQAGASALVKAPDIILEGNAKCTGTFEVQGKFTFQAGMAGKGGGEMTDGDLTVNGIPVADHDHIEHDNFTTQKAKKAG